MTRKILNSNTKSNRLHGTSKGKIGTELNLLDKNNNKLKVGDKITYREYTGRLLYNHYYSEYGIALEYSKWYGDNEYSIDSYGKFISIPMDNGAKMEIELIEEVV